MTKRRTVDISSPWRYSSNNSDIYYGMGSTQSAMIGQNSKSADDNAKLIINTNDNNQRHVIFKQAGTKVGELWIKSPNFLFGSEFSNSIVGISNTAFGHQSLMRNTTGAGNVAFGYQALVSNITGNSNTAIGENTLSSNTSSQNTAIGYEALMSNSSGYNNTATGSRSMLSNSTGTENVAYGADTLLRNTVGKYNTAVGYQGLYSNTTGENNVALGAFGLHNNSTGTANTAVGYHSLVHNRTGIWNTGVGYGACQNITGSNKTCIGAVSGPTGTDSSTTNVVYLGSSETSAIVSGVSSISVYSDKRLKDVKEEYKKGLEQIRDVVPKLFIYKSDKEKNIRLGVIAQELQKVLPEAVVKNGDGYLIVHQEYIQYALLNAVKQLDKIVQSLITEVKTMVAKLSYHDNKIKKLEQECADLKQENNAMKQENAELKARLEKLEKFVF